jgi:hypothetical protein
MSIREGKRTVDKVRAKVDSLDGDFIYAARQRARDYGNRFVFSDCDVRHLPDLPGAPDQWSHLANLRCLQTAPPTITLTKS